MNLISDFWIPIRRLSGAHELIAPWQLTERHEDDPVVALSSPRADFDGALMQFLIGLFQSVLAPEDYEAWIDGYEEPPAAEELHEAMASYADAFELFGERQSFMQDAELVDGEPREIAALLIEAPGGNTLRQNVDHFIKRGGAEALCPSCAATALYCLQTNAPAGGVGHRTSLRGGGPLTTLVIADPHNNETGLVATLWRNVWLNVLERSAFSRYQDVKRNEPADIFPWLAATRTSEAKTGRETTPEDVHPLQMYWGMPRRIRLLRAEKTSGHCGICGSASETLCESYLTKNYGVNYTGAWRHPLSPHNVNKDGMPLPMHPQPGGLPYSHWLGLVQAAETKTVRREPARIVQAFWEKRSRDVQGQHRVWAFGYDMDNMKARCWYDSTIPLYHLPPESRKLFEDNAGKLILAATEVASNLRGALRKAWFRRPKDKGGDTSFISAAFWQSTESSFYGALADIHAKLSDSVDLMAARRAWLCYLNEASLALFDQWALGGPIEDSDPRRIALARHELRKFNHSSRLLNELGLPTQRQQKPAAVPQGELA